MSNESTPNDFTNLPGDAVISLEGKACSIVGQAKTFLVSEGTSGIAKNFSFLGLNGSETVSVQQAWGKAGVPAQVLISGQGWQKGLVRISIEFCPEPEPELEADEPEPETANPEDSATEPEDPGSLLDDIRQTLLQNRTE